MRYELESLDDFMAKLKDLKVEEVGMRVELTGRDVQVKQLVRAKPEDAATEQIVTVKEASARLILSAVGLKKEIADTFEIPLLYSEQLESGVLITSEAAAADFTKKIEVAKQEAINALQEGFGKKIILGAIVATQHSNYRPLPHQ